jgi:thioredoxin 1
MSNTKDITLSDFEQMKQEGGLYLLDFWATWCPPCKMMGPIIDDLSKDEDLSKINFVKVDTDQENELASQFGIRSIPTFLLINFKGKGKFDKETDIVHKIIGAKSAFDFKMELQEVLSKLENQEENA